MRRRYLKKFGAVVFAALMLSGVAFVSASQAEAQTGRRVIIVRNYPRFYRPYRLWGDPYYSRYNPRSPYYEYRQYVFNNSDKAEGQGYKDGFKTGRDDGKKNKSFDPQRSHYFQEAGFGNFGEIYRGGFARGYQEGYREGQRAS
ncbi:MAG TPA: hypothetical protein VLL54_19730 [Pyrinomonadaceae bacterium]|nr:hypothetical protein [Pyrinomonadaceae bacterium]